MKNALADFNFFYSLLRPFVDYGTYNHYRNVIFKGRENLPTDGPYILAPCHQNALMDALLVLNITHRPVAFLARADIFKNPKIAACLNFLRISPVYRIRDGRDQLSQNDEVFKRCRQVLEKGVPLCLMAEGTHNNKHQLLPLVKGMFRIALGTQEELGKKPLYIVPVGMDYDSYEDLYSTVILNIGEPIPVSQYMQEYKENEPIALNHMRADLAKALKAQMHHVDSVDHYEDEYAYCHMMTQQTIDDIELYDDAWGRFQARQYISQELAKKTDEEKNAAYAKGAAFAAEMKSKQVPLWFSSKSWSMGKSIWSLAAVLVTLALILPRLKDWLLSNLIVYIPTHLWTKKNIKDPQFRSSVNFGIRLAATFIYILIATIIACITRGVGDGILFGIMGIISVHVTPRIFILLRDALYGFRQLKGRQ